MSDDGLPECPVALNYLWDWFIEISLGIETGGYGPASITWPVLSAWCDLMRQALEPWETMTLVRLGMLRASIASEKQETGKA